MQLLEVLPGKRLQLLLAFLRQPEANAPGVLRVGNPADQPESGQAIDQLYGGVMPDQQETRDVTDRRGTRANEALDAQQRLMLRRRQSLLGCCGLAERQK